MSINLEIHRNAFSPQLCEGGTRNMYIISSKDKRKNDFSLVLHVLSFQLIQA